MDIKQALNKIADRKDLTGEEMRGVMRIIMAGEATQSQIGAFLMGMRIKGETVGEIAAAVSILREQMVPVIAPEGAVDIVGTGGDGIDSHGNSRCRSGRAGRQAWQQGAVVALRLVAGA
jgi:anthranilate phosphoribosyltransferase